jgi:tetratricopeptide (TPR) repeat protein
MEEADLAYASAHDFLLANSWDQAVPRLQSILEVCPSHVLSLRGLGKAYKEMGRFEDALDVYERAIQVLGADVEANDYASLGGVYAKLKKYPEARNMYMRAKALSPDDCGILFNLGMLHMGVQAYRDAVETLEHAHQKCPQFKDNVLPQLANACEKAAAKEEKIGNVAQAAAFRQKYSRYAGVAGGSTLYDQITKQMREGKLSEAAASLKKLLAESPDHAPGWLSLARCHDGLGQKAEAINAYQEYLKLKPDDETGTGELIIAYTEAGRCQEGINLAQQAKTRFQPKGKQYLASIHYGWGKALECAGRYSEAKDQFYACIDCGDPKYSRPSRAELTRMDQLMERAAAEKKKAGGS